MCLYFKYLYLNSSCPKSKHNKKIKTGRNLKEKKEFKVLSLKKTQRILDTQTYDKKHTHSRTDYILIIYNKI